MSLKEIVRIKTEKECFTKYTTGVLTVEILRAILLSLKGKKSLKKKTRCITIENVG